MGDTPDFYIGQKVVCTQAAELLAAQMGLREGMIYTVSALTHTAAGLGLMLYELDSAPYQGWRAERFRAYDPAEKTQPAADYYEAITT